MTPVFFLDTDILVDVLRGLEVATQWLESSRSETFRVPGISAMELIVGCRNGSELGQIQNFIQTFQLTWTRPEEFKLALEILALHHLSAGLGIPDAIIAAMTVHQKGVLYTFNDKHFRGIEELRIERPYDRTGGKAVDR